jgi:phage head maturation protease
MPAAIPTLEVRDVVALQALCAGIEAIVVTRAALPETAVALARLQHLVEKERHRIAASARAQNWAQGD